MTVDLPEDLALFIRSLVRSGRFATEAEAVADAVRRVEGQAAEPPEAVGAPTPEPVPAWQRVLETMRDVPDAEFDRIPADSSEQLDHYLHGSPRRPAP